MGENLQESLVVLAEGGAGEARRRLQSRFRVLQVASSRLMVVQGSAGDVAAALASSPGVVAVTDMELSPEALAGLEGTDATWASAWSQRGRPKKRAGDGLDWDAPGFEPPDSPKSTKRR